MSAQLPQNPNLEQLKKQAKALLKAHQTGEPEACSRIQGSFPRLARTPVLEISNALFSLRDAQLVLAREYGFKSWPKLKRFIEILSQDPHRLIVLRVAQLIAEHVEESAEVIRRMLDESEKSAILMITLGQETTAEIMKHFSDVEIEQIAQSISNLDVVTTQQEDTVLEEFELLLSAEKGISLGRVDYQAIEETLNQAKKKAILKVIQRTNHQISKLIPENSREAIKSFQTMKNEPGIVNILANSLDDEILSRLEIKKEKSSKLEGTEQERDVLDEFERRFVARAYVSRGGLDYARGALKKAMGPSRAKVFLDPIKREILLERISRLLSELPESATLEVIQTLERDPGKLVILKNILDQKIPLELEENATPELNGITWDEEDETLEEFEQLLVTRNYISRGGVDYARGALEKSLGQRKTQVLLNRITKESSL